MPGVMVDEFKAELPPLEGDATAGNVPTLRKGQQPYPILAATDYNDPGKVLAAHMQWVAGSIDWALASNKATFSTACEAITKAVDQQLDHQAKQGSGGAHGSLQLTEEVAQALQAFAGFARVIEAASGNSVS